MTFTGGAVQSEGERARRLPRTTPVTAPSAASVRRIAARGRGPAGALVAPFVQAISSLVLQVIAVRELGAEGFGVYALLYSGVLMAMALSNGLVGDSLTVLDRADPPLRGAMSLVALVSTGAVAIVGMIVAGVTGIVSFPLAALFAAALAAFLAENLLRRVLMSVLMFWRLVAMDAMVFVGMLVVLGGSYLATGGDLGMGHILGSLLAGQLTGIAAGLALIPPTERWLGERSREVGPIVRYGSWRASQQAVRPSALTVIRIIVVVSVGTAVFGELEAARVYTAPAMLLVNGAASYFLASFSSRPGKLTTELRHRADIGAALLALALVGFGAVIVVALPIAGGIVAGQDFDLDAVAVAGWVAYAAGCALIMPYASLASVRGGHARMVGMRLVEAAGSAVAVALVLQLDVGVSWVPLAVAVSPLALVPVIRRQALTSTRPGPEPKATSTASTAGTP
ncbi:MAG: hypothetical protein OSA99_13270 [Acidimicrobiales bacterium]|nr:hypothetical protein [Acidimicrobiales bacterium]